MDGSSTLFDEQYCKALRLNDDVDGLTSHALLLHGRQSLAFTKTLDKQIASLSRIHQDKAHH